MDDYPYSWSRPQKKVTNPLLDENDSDPDVINIEMHAVKNVENVEYVENIGNIGNTRNRIAKVTVTVNDPSDDEINPYNDDSDSDSDSGDSMYGDRNNYQTPGNIAQKGHVSSIHVTPGNFDDYVYSTPGGHSHGVTKGFITKGGTDDGTIGVTKGVTKGGHGNYNNGYSSYNGDNDKLEPLTQYSEVMSEKKSVVNKIIDVDRDKSLWFCVFYYGILI